MDLKPIFEKLYPENSYGGQCGTFAHKLTSFPSVGNYLWNKKAAVRNFGYPASSAAVGDVLITKESLLFGHVATINNDVGNWQLTESNYNLNLRVHHTRQIAKNSPEIIGVIKGAPLYQMPETPWITNLRIKWVMNHQPDWQSLSKHNYNVMEWFWKNSGGHILPVIDYAFTTFANWPSKYQPDSLGNNPVKIIDEQWFDQNVLPIGKDFDCVIFCMPKKDWTDTVLNDPSKYELGYAYEYAPQQPDLRTKLPLKALIALDENDDYAPYYPDIGGFGKYVAHELSHLLYGIACKDSFPAGTDLTHVHAYGLNGYPQRLEDIFADFDYKKLRDTIGH